MGGSMRKIPLSDVTPETSLHRCLNTRDLTLMGLGAMIGSGIYVMTGKACRYTSGPSLVVSFLLAAVIILLVAGCFTELAARVQKTGSTYLYMYIILGELPAFLVGFSTLVLSVLGGATNARAWSGYLDSLTNGLIANYTMSVTGEWTVGPPVAAYPDFIASLVMLIITFIIALGAKCQSWINSVFVVLNILILLFVIIVGFSFADIQNWTNPETGGFFPFGVSGVIGGAAVCFWAFSGFEILSCAVEEAENPHRGLPVSTVLSLLIVTVLYSLTAGALTILTPYTTIDLIAPLPSAFAARGLHWAQYIVAIGPLCGLTTTLMASLYSCVRIAFKMSEDGLLFGWMGWVTVYSKVPVISVVVFGSLMAVTALFLDVNELISFSVIIILGSYAFVCACVIILRYTPSSTEKADASNPSDQDDSRLYLDRSNGHITARPNQSSDSDWEELTFPALEEFPGGLRTGCQWLWPCNKLSPGTWASAAVCLISAAMLVAAILSVYLESRLVSGTWWVVILFTSALMTVLSLLVTVYFHKQSAAGVIVKMPCVPLLPTLGMCSCIYLVVSIAEPAHWIGVVVLLGVSLILYYSYSYRNSKLYLRTNKHLPTTASFTDTAALLNSDSSEEDEL